LRAAEDRRHTKLQSNETPLIATWYHTLGGKLFRQDLIVTGAFSLVNKYFSR
jgi:hypothetical protein